MRRISIKRADFMDTVRILICAVHGNEAFDGQHALCRWNCSRFLEHGNSQARGRSACFVPVMQKMQNNRNFTLSPHYYPSLSGICAVASLLCTSLPACGGALQNTIKKPRSSKLDAIFHCVLRRERLSNLCFQEIS